MGLRAKIEEKYISALKLKKPDTVNALRLIKSAIKDKDIENRSSENKEVINDSQILIVLQNLVKQRRDSIVSFTEASRNDLIDREKKEIEIISQFLPKQLDENDIKSIIEKFISDNNILAINEMGKIMGFLKTDYSGKIDMSIAGRIAKEILTK